MAHHGDDYLPSVQSLKGAFHKADAELIAGLNGIGRAPASDVEAAELRRALMRARAECEEAGIEVETVLEFSERTRRENEANLREYAAVASTRVHGIDRHRRRWLAWIVAGVGGVATAACLWTPEGLFGGLVAALMIQPFAKNWLADRYPTPGVLIGKRAFERRVGVIDIWRQDSDDTKDYRDTYWRLELRARAADRGPTWIKAR
jgi:hypothetical protein